VPAHVEHFTDISILSDETLWHRYHKSQDSDSMEILIRRYSNLAYRIARCVCSNDALADEAVQDGFLRIVRIGNKFEDRGAGSFRAWFCNVIVNTARGVRRKEAREKTRTMHLSVKEHEKERIEGMKSPNDEPERLEIIEKVRLALWTLSEESRLIVVMHYLEGMSQDQIAQVVGIKQPQISRRLTRILASLRETLAAQGSPVTAVALTAILENQQLLTPKLSSVDSLVLACQKQAHADRGEPSKARFSRKLILLGVVATCATSAATLILMYPYSNHRTAQEAPAGGAAEKLTPARTEAPQSAKVPMYFKKWDFNDARPNEGITPVTGSWHWTSTDGVGNSGCMELPGDLFSAHIEAPKSIKRFKVSFNLRMIKYGKNKYNAGISWDPCKSGCILRNIGKETIIDRSHEVWIQYCCYLMDGHVDTWVNNQRATLIFLEPFEDAKLKLSVRGPHHIDDLAVSEISAEDAPDISKYRLALSKVPMEKRSGSVIVAGLPGERDTNAPVVAEFLKD